MNRSDQFKYLISNTKEPVVFKNVLNWPILSWDLKKWEEVLHDEKLPFRCGKNARTKSPQWERTTSVVTKTFSEFVEHTKNENNEYWMYFDYKYLAEWFQNIAQIRKHINWDEFGFSNLSPDESTIWIGSQGAHTPCHIDTYGCNLIAQVFGRKQWLLFPPEENLKPTRIPYEESSIYSKINFFTPNLPIDEIPSTKCQKIILEAGDVLFLPHKWWHYVENLETAISVNVWLPQEKIDDEERLSESIVNFLITQLSKNLNPDEKKVILNPNSDDDASSSSFNSSLELIKNAKGKLLQKTNNKKRNQSAETVEGDDDRDLKLLKIFAQYPENLKRLPKLGAKEFENLLKFQSSKFQEVHNNEETSDENLDEIVGLFEVISNSEVIQSIIKNYK